MKKKIVLLSSALLATLIIGLTGCSKDDTTSPVVTVTGDASMEVILNDTYTDEGATATDDEDGSVSVSTSGTVDVDHTGTYTITYTATDEAGNVGSASRTVRVYNEAEIFVGTYANSYDSCSQSGAGMLSPAPVVSISETENRKVLISNFGGLGDSAKVTVKFNGLTDGSTITGNTPQFTQGAVSVTQFMPQSVIVSAVSGVTSFNIMYQWSDGVNNDVCVTQYRR
jgi:hypothetical protein